MASSVTTSTIVGDTVAGFIAGPVGTILNRITNTTKEGSKSPATTVTSDTSLSFSGTGPTDTVTFTGAIPFVAGLNTAYNLGSTVINTSFGTSEGSSVNGVADTIALIGTVLSTGVFGLVGSLIGPMITSGANLFASADNTANESTTQASQAF